MYKYICIFKFFLIKHLNMIGNILRDVGYTVHCSSYGSSLLLWRCNLGFLPMAMRLSFRGWVVTDLCHMW